MTFRIQIVHLVEKEIFSRRKFIILNYNRHQHLRQNVSNVTMVESFITFNRHVNQHLHYFN